MMANSEAVGLDSATSKPSSPTSSASENPAEGPYFFPPLYLQRQVFCMDAIRREGVRSVLEVGCGEGSLLSALCEPALHVDNFPPVLPAASRTSNSPNELAATVVSKGFTPGSVKHNSSAEDPSDCYASTGLALEARLGCLKAVPPPDPSERELHLRSVMGLDIRLDRLKLAARTTAPRTDPDPAHSSSHTSPAWQPFNWERWEPLRVELWEGSLDQYNESFENAELIVASEVIEHLPAAVLDKFASVILGRYNPRVVIVTTPNYDFNAYFPIPRTGGDGTASRVDEGKYRFKDPTGRTERIFRDDDHKFEWTSQEFRTWANEAAAAHDFDVSFSGCGTYANYFGRITMTDTAESSPRKLPQSPPGAPPPPTEPTAFFATQCAIFRTRSPYEPERTPRSPRPSFLPFLSAPSPRVVPHALRYTHVHPVHPRAKKPKPPAKVREAVQDLMQSWGTGEMQLRSLWSAGSEVREAAGGEICKVVEAVAAAMSPQSSAPEAECPAKAWDIEIREGTGTEAVWLIWNEYKDEKPEEDRSSPGLDNEREEQHQTAQDDADPDEPPVFSPNDGPVNQADKTEEVYQWDSSAAEVGTWGMPADVEQNKEHADWHAWC